MIKQEWVDMEMGQYDCKKRKKKDMPTFEFLKILMLLTAVFFYTSTVSASENQGDTYVLNSGKGVYVDAGVWFRCEKCQTCQWQSNDKANWRGEFFCVKCGAKMR